MKFFKSVAIDKVFFMCGLLVAAAFWMVVDPASAEEQQAVPPAAGSGNSSGVGGFVSDVFSGSVNAFGVTADAIMNQPPDEVPLVSRPNTNYQPYYKGYQVSKQLSIRPVAQYSRIHDTNVYRTESGRKEDNINRIVTGGSVGYSLDPKNRYRLALSYTALLEYFDRYSREDHDDHIIGSSGTFQFDSFTLRTNGKWSRIASRDSINLPDPVNITETTNLGGTVEIPLGTTFAEAQIVNDHYDYLNPVNNPFSRNEMWSYGRYGLNLSAVNQLYAEYGYLNVDYMEFEERNADANQYGVGLRYYPNKSVTSSFFLGYQERIYDTDEKPDFYGLVGSVKFQKKFAHQNGITLGFERKSSETTYLGTSFATQNRFNYDYLTPFLSKDLYLTQRGGVGYDEYAQTTSTGGDDQTRRDYVWNQGIGLEYFMPQWSSSLYCLYTYTSIDSNTAGLDIDVQQITYGIKGQF